MANQKTAVAKQSNNTPPSNLGLKLLQHHPYIQFEWGLANADSNKITVPSNKTFSHILLDCGDRNETIVRRAPFWTGTVAAYTKPGAKLGKALEHIDPKTGFRWIFPVPKEFQSTKNAAIVSEHPNYTIEIEKKDRVILSACADLVEVFPPDNGYFLADPLHEIPILPKRWKEDPDARYLYRMGSYVGPVGRAMYSGYSVWEPHRGIHLDRQPSEEATMAVEFLNDHPQPHTYKDYGVLFPDAPLEIMVADRNGGILITNTNTAEFGGLLREADSELQSILKSFPGEKLEALRTLLDALKQK